MNMKSIAMMLTASLFFTSSFAQKSQVDNHIKNLEKTINSHWTFNYFPASDQGKGYELPVYDDSKWPAISIPHTWDNYETTKSLNSSKNADGSDNPYWKTGWGWYRKHFLINKVFDGKKVFVEFSDIRKYCKVWINGKYLGEHSGSGVSFAFDLTSYIKPGAENLLAVAVTQNPQNGLADLPEKTDESPGISDNVTIVLKDKLYIPVQGSALTDSVTIVTTPEVSEKEAAIRIQTFVKNDYSQKLLCNLLTTITDNSGKVIQSIKSEAEIDAGQLLKFDQIGKAIKNPHLWSTEDPYLYRIESSVIKDKIVTDLSSAYFRFFKPDSKENAIVEQSAKIFSDKNIANNVNIISSGETPVRIVLSGTKNNFAADRGSTIKIEASILDAKGNPTGLPKSSLRWNVSGPATLVGPYISDPEVLGNASLSNSIRSAGQPGKIHVTTSASGLISGVYEIEASEVITDNSVIQEPVLLNEGRKGVKREVIVSKRLAGVPVEINSTEEEIVITLPDGSGNKEYKKLIRDYISKNNPAVDTSSVELVSLTEILAVQLTNYEGRLPVEDFNLSAGNYNNCRLIARYINSTKLPQLFKDGLRKYYSDEIIKKGNEKDAGDEMNWLNWIPSGGTVVVVQDEHTTQIPKGVVLTKSADLKDIIASVYPQFAGFSAEAKERALLFTGKANPYVHNIGKSVNADEGEIIQGASYVAEKGQPILVPLLKFISE